MRLSSFKSKALLANVVFWLLYMFFGLLAFVIDSDRKNRVVDAYDYILPYLISFVPWMLVTPIFYYFLNKAQQKQGFRIIPTVFVLLFCWIPFVIFFEGLSSSMMETTTPEKTLLDIISSMPLWYFIYYAILYFAVVGACVSMIYYRSSTKNHLESLRANQKNIKLELELSELQMKSLQTQLEPHFLFNSLNSISSLVRISEKQQALDAIKQLSDLLRYAVIASKKLFVLLDNELEFIKDYLSLQSLRFEDKLNFTIQDEREKNNQECLPFLLQIFVENAIRHGLEKEGSSMTLEIKISESNEQVFYAIKNSHQKNLKNNDTLGIGLENLRDRLNILYDEKIELNILETEQFYNVEFSTPAYAK